MNSESHESTSAGPEPSPRQTTQEKLDDLSRVLTEAIRKGGRDAGRAVSEGLPKVKAEFAQGLYEVAYALGYAATFGASVVREATPESLSKGFREGSASGRRAADEAMRQRRERSEQAAADDSEGAWA